MAYMDQERKAIIGAALKLATAGTGLKYSLSVRNHSYIVMTMKSGPIDFISDYNQVGAMQPRSGPATNYLYINKYFFQEHFSPGVQVVIRKIVDAMHSAGHYDRSDIQSDYFDCAYYMEIQVGAWDKPYILTK
jgi:hypothetical protein